MRRSRPSLRQPVITRQSRVTVIMILEKLKEMLCSWRWTSSNRTRSYGYTFWGLNSYWSAAIETNFGTNLKNLPARWLAPGTIRMLWMQMCQEAKGVSYKHFWTVFRQNWHQILRFLPSSSHGACDTCVAFKSGFRKALHPQEKFHNAKAYKAHIDSVCQDRDLEAFLQVSNPLANAGSALCLHFVSCLDLVCANDLASFSVKATIVHTKLLCHCGKPKAALMSLKAHQAPYTFLSHAPIYQ